MPSAPPTLAAHESPAAADACPSGAEAGAVAASAPSEQALLCQDVGLDGAPSNEQVGSIADEAPASGAADSPVEQIMVKLSSGKDYPLRCRWLDSTRSWRWQLGPKSWKWTKDRRVSVKRGLTLWLEAYGRELEASSLMGAEQVALLMDEPPPMTPPPSQTRRRFRQGSRGPEESLIPASVGDRAQLIGRPKVVISEFLACPAAMLLNMDILPQQRLPSSVVELVMDILVQLPEVAEDATVAVL